MVQTRAGAWRHKLVVGVLFSTMVLAGVWQSPASADVTAVEGSAENCSSQFDFFGNPQTPIGPTASVTLPPGGSATPVTETGPCTIRVFIPPNNAPGPIILSAASVEVSTQGTTGPTGSVTSTAEATDVGTDENEALQAASITSTCTADESGVSGSTTVSPGATVVTDQDADTTEAVPENPAPGFSIEGINGAGDSYRYIFNEQTVNPDGSITVTAVHLELLGPNAIGDVYLGEVVCGVTADGQSGTTTTVDDGATTTTAGNGGGTTTTMGNGGGTTTTTAGNGGGTTTTTQPAPGPGGCERPTDFVGALIFDIFRGISDLLANLGITGFEDFGCEDEEDSDVGFDFDGDFGFDDDFGDDADDEEDEDDDEEDEDDEDDEDADDIDTGTGAGVSVS